MGEQIEFPKNYTVYMAEVMNALQKGNIVTAIDYMKKAYRIKKEDSLNILLVSSLLQVGDNEEALLLADSKPDFYEADEKRLLIYVEVLIENNQILKAEKYINEQLTNTLAKYSESWIRLADQLNELKELQEKNRQKEEEKLLRNLFSLPSLNTLEQFSRMKDIYKLTNPHLIQLAEQLLVNPYIHPFNRATLFSLLTERGMDRQIKYLWFGESKDINPINTLSIEESPTAARLFEELDAVLSKNPSLYQLAENELKTLLLMLYPFEKDSIVCGEERLWIEAIIQTLELTEETQINDENTKLLDIARRIKKIREELLRFEGQ
ncbi:hypothetical protein [Alkalibacterium kapii]|uniref:Hydrolase n=1 Tax=Alkalibacterium kapii TaxID=426704 RepID=A0A511AZ93_9LACT|nr:hypothetical protein [Alkalibacterium kapii]GEK90927.1 hypothetical protein AKA01nite_05490 [Alkalibacterium kapii]